MVREATDTRNQNLTFSKIPEDGGRGTEYIVATIVMINNILAAAMIGTVIVTRQRLCYSKDYCRTHWYVRPPPRSRHFASR